MSGIVVIGASVGGLRAVERLLAGLPADFPAPVVVVQHRADDHSGVLHGLLDRHCALQVCEAEDKGELKPGCVLVAPGGYHTLVEEDHVELSAEAEVAFSRPSIDVTFESAARTFGPLAVGVVLTGANEDGAAGLAAIRAHGGTAIVQDPAEALNPRMPEAAIAAADPHWVLRLEAIPARWVALAEETIGR
jgi:two-component system chemotaxis response regulator CheB